MSLTFALDAFLRQHGVSAYRLEKETVGIVARGSIYAMAQSESVLRLDLKNVTAVLAALGAILGRPVALQELFQGEVAPAPLRSSRAGVAYTGHRETDEIFDDHPEILKRVAAINLSKEVPS